MDLEKTDLPQLLKELNAIGIALSAEKDHNRLLEMILIRSKEITNADGGTLYTSASNNSFCASIRDWLVIVTAACEARDSTSCCSIAVNALTSPVSGVNKIVLGGCFLM